MYLDNATEKGTLEIPRKKCFSQKKKTKNNNQPLEKEEEKGFLSVTTMSSRGKLSCIIFLFLAKQ